MKTHTTILLHRSALSLLLLTPPLTGHAVQTRNIAPATTQKVVANKALAWTEWELTAPTYTGLERPPFLKFTDARLGASVGLNSISGAYTLGGKNITITPLVSTRKAGPAPLMNAEERYNKALQSARSFEVSADGQRLTLRGGQTLSFRLTGRTSQGFVPTETKIINVAPQLGPQLDGDRTPKYLQLEDLSEGVSWGRFSEAKIVDFNFVPGYRYQIRVVVERNARSGAQRLRLLEIISQQWMRTAKLAANDKILEVAPTRVECVGVMPMKCLQAREVGGQWRTFYTRIQGFDFQEGWRYRLQVAVTKIENPPAHASNLRYKLVRVLDKLPVIR
jgi:heat shock protein HslJ